MQFKRLLFIFPLLTAFYTNAALITVATDNASNYNDQWLGNGGNGFDSWQFITDTSSGNAGGFLASTSGNPDLNGISSSGSGKAWGSYANGGGFNQFEAYRGFGQNSLVHSGDHFSVKLEHGNIVQGGAVGFVLRNQNQSNSIGDYNANSRFEFGFIGGSQNYSIFDGTGWLDTGIGFLDSGLKLDFYLLSADSYKFDVINAVGHNLISSFTGQLKGSGSIDSVALYNRDAELGNAYFNYMQIAHEETNLVNAPSAFGFFLICCLYMFGRGRLNRLNKG